MVTIDPAAPLILLVEDDLNHAELIRRALEDAAETYRLENCSSMQQALAFLQTETPALLITDYRLPDGDGIALHSATQGLCPTLLMTSHGNEQVAVEAMKSGVLDYLIKSPDLFTGMQRIVRRTLREWRLIEEQKETAQQIIETKEEWEETFDAIPDLITIIDANHRIERVNKAMCQLSGLPPEELVGRACYEVVHGCSSPPDSCPHKRLIQQQTYQNQEMGAELLDGIFDVSVSPLFNPDGSIRACVHIARDISQRLQAEKEKAELEEQLRHAQRMHSIGILASGVAHDFNNIITAIVGYAHILELQLPQESALLENIFHIKEAAQRATKITDDLLQFSRKQPFAPRIINFDDVLLRAQSLLQRLAGNAITIQLDTEQTGPHFLYADEFQLAQVAMNLVSNARDAMPEGGTISIRLEHLELDDEHARQLGLAAPGLHLRILFTDTGHGIPKDKIAPAVSG